MAVLADKLAAQRADGAPGAGKSTLNRLELSRRRRRVITRSRMTGQPSSGCSSRSSRRRRTPPGRIMLDLDATDDPLHGHQEGRFFDGYYGCYCYCRSTSSAAVTCSQPSCGLKHRRRGRCGGGDGRIVAQIRARWPKIRIVLRADSGFARDALMTSCEASGIDYIWTGPERTSNPHHRGQFADARDASRTTGRPRAASRNSSGRPAKLEPQGRVVGKAEWTQGEANPRSIVTTLTAPTAMTPSLRTRLLRARRDGEPHQGVSDRPVADRTSTATMMANQLRRGSPRWPTFSVESLRRIACRGSLPMPIAAPSAQAVPDRRSRHHQRRRIKFAMASGCPNKAVARATSSPAAAEISPSPAPRRGRHSRIVPQGLGLPPPQTVHYRARDSPSVSPTVQRSPKAPIRLR